MECSTPSVCEHRGQLGLHIDLTKLLAVRLGMGVGQGKFSRTMFVGQSKARRYTLSMADKADAQLGACDKI